MEKSLKSLFVVGGIFAFLWYVFAPITVFIVDTFHDIFGTNSKLVFWGIVIFFFIRSCLSDEDSKAREMPSHDPLS